MRAGSEPISRRSRKTAFCFHLLALLLGIYLSLNTIINGKLRTRKNQVERKFDPLHLNTMLDQIIPILRHWTIREPTIPIKLHPKKAQERLENLLIQVNNGAYLEQQQKRELLKYINKEIVEINKQFISEMRKANRPEHHIQEWTKHYQKEMKRMDLSSYI